MAAGRTLVVMEGGHPWGFRIEGGAEVREPIRINKVLGGGKAYSHGIEVGDILSRINGESASYMTISRARHLIRTSDDLLVLEVTRPSKEFLRIPEIRVISPNENQIINTTTFQWAPNEVPESQRNLVNTEKVGTRSMFSESSPQKVISKVPPVPPPKPPRQLPLTVRNSLLQTQTNSPKQAKTFTFPVSPSHAAPLMGHSINPAVPNRNTSVADGGTNSSQTQPGRQVTRSSTPIPRNSNYPGKWTFTVYSPPSSPKSGEIQTQRHNTEPASIKPCGLSKDLFTGKLETVENKPLWTRKADPLEAKQFHQRTTGTGTVDKGLSSTAVVLPLSSTFRTAVSENQFTVGNQYVAEHPYDLLPNQQTFNVQGQNKALVHYQNFYNNRNLGTPVSVSKLDKGWSKKIEDFETGYDSSASQDDSKMFADYDFLPQKPFCQNNLRNSGREDTLVFGDRTSFCKDQIMGRQNHLMFSDKRYHGVTTREKLDEENLRRKLEIERVIAEEKRRRHLKDLSADTARRHSDYFTPLQRSSPLMDRFTYNEIADTLARPIKRVYTKIRGKARALHTFRAQSSRELPFKKYDIIYILRQVDKNWFEGEHHGMVGIFPITYVEVLTSLDEARATAELREGTANAIYNFKAQTELELPLRKGDVVTLIRRVDKNWYEGRLGRRQGIFPVTYVETYREPDTPMVTPMSSHAPTPLPGTPASCQSPVSSLYSVGPEIPSAPMSPLDSEFYESDWDTASLGAVQPGQPLRTSRSTSPAHSQISDREVTPVRGVMPPFFTGPSNPRFSYEGLGLQSRSLQPKPSMQPYNQMGDRDITPVRTVSSPLPASSANAQYSSVGSRIPGAGFQQKPSTMPCSQIPDREITPVRALSSPTPTGTANARYSLDGARNQTPSLKPKPSMLPNIQTVNRYITPIREVTSSTPIDSASAQYSSDGCRIQSPDLQPKPPATPNSPILDHDTTSVRAVASPTPTGSAKDRISYESPKVQNPSSQLNSSMLPYSQNSDHEVTPVRAVVSPTPIVSAHTLPSSDESKIQRPDLQQTFMVPVDLHLRKEEIVDATGIKETDKRLDLVTQTQGQGNGQGQGKNHSSSVANSTSTKPNAATQRPPSGRTGSQTLRASKQKLPVKQQPNEGRDRRDGFSKSSRTPNPYLRYRAVYSYKPQNIDELELIHGDIIYVMERCDDGWFVGISDKTKKFGSFPGNFVRPM